MKQQIKRFTYTDQANTWLGNTSNFTKIISIQTHCSSDNHDIIYVVYVK